MQDFRNLKVWHKAHQLTLDVYRATQAFPREELFGLTSQIRRAGMSIPADIAEGCGRSSSAEYRRFVQIALGSASELEYHLLLGRDLAYLSETTHLMLQSQVEEIKRMLSRLRDRIGDRLISSDA